MHTLVTAGSTRERIDQVRDWGNIFTGNTGFSIAQEMAKLGTVDLLTSNATHLAMLSPHIRGQQFSSHAELRTLLARVMREHAYDAIFMTAAVSDYAPAGAFAVKTRTTNADGSETWTVNSAQAGKVKSNFEKVAFLGKRTEKLVDLFRTTWGYKKLLVKFKLEVDITSAELIRIGQASRLASGADFLVANTLDMVHGENAGAFLLGENLEEWVPRATLSSRLASLASAAI